jgi:hypothetical protein
MAKKTDPTIQQYEVSGRVAQQALVRDDASDRGGPLFRPLRIYTLDPSVSDRHGGIATVMVPYEKLKAGPVGALFDVRCDRVPKPLSATPLDLDEPQLLLSSGLSPTPSNGRFHLQMVYAVSSLTYAVFKRALGREIAWAIPPAADGSHRLILRPFGFRGRNAGYNRETSDISFGYFETGKEPAGFIVPKGLICTALSHDIIAHETTHALLDGLRSSFMNPTNVDVPAFHEALADLVALFLHFSYPDVVEQAIRDWRSTTPHGSLLTDIAREFGHARSRSTLSALRSGVDVEGILAFDSDVPTSKENQPLRYGETDEPHALGSVLVSAVFEAFTTIVKRKAGRYFRIAGLTLQDLGAPTVSDALIKAIAQEASDVAGQFLNICIRAVDYCPPADIELGEYLRALITADSDLERTDKWGFREALMRSFRRRQIFPEHVKFMTEDAVRWQSTDEPLRIAGLAFRDLEFNGDPGQPASAKELNRQAHSLGRFVTDPKHARAFQLVSPAATLPKNVVQASPPQVESVRVSRRAAPDGRIVFDLVGEVTQACTVKLAGDLFEMNGGCTIVIDPYGTVRYAIYKRLTSDARQHRQHAAMRGPLKSLWRKTGRHFTLERNLLRLVHALAPDRA